ncbi:MAG TPA: hypothetical protein VFH94_15445 [Streptomyces sp.]|nr:hypothetical protein [Streptomyces sp.]
MTTPLWSLGVVPRVNAAGRELAGPQRDTPPSTKAEGAPGRGDTAAPGDSGGAAGAGWTGIAAAAAAGGEAVLVVGIVLVTVRRRAARATTRGGA